MLSERLGQASGQLTLASGALISCAALFEQVLPAAGGPAAAEILGDRTDGSPAAMAIYEQALAAAPLEVSSVRNAQQCSLAVASQACARHLPC